MSFIYNDKDLINKLVNAGSEFEDKYVKRAQTVAPTNSDKTYLQALVSNLQQESANTVDLPPDTKLDSVGNVFAQDGSVGEGTVPLTVIDLRSATTFNRWMKTNSIQISTGGQAYPFGDPHFDARVVIRGLLARAQAASNNATSDEEKSLGTSYAKVVSNLMPSVTFNGQSAGHAPGTTGNTEDNKRIQSQLAQALPFNDSNIDFAKIKTFFKLYLSLLSQNNDEDARQRIQSVNSYIASANQSMDDVTNNQSNNMFRFPMTQSTGASTVSSWLKSPPGNHFKPLLVELNNVLTQTNNVVLDVGETNKYVSSQDVLTQTSIFERQKNLIDNLLSQTAQ